MNKFAIFVNSHPSFQDCWRPFFQLLQKYYPESSDNEIYLNSNCPDEMVEQIKSYGISCLAQPNLGRSWSEDLLNGLAQIRCPHILYFQEDYFLNARVNVPAIERALQTLDQSKDTICVNLTPYGSPPASRLKPGSSITWSKPKTFTKYYVTLQASLWRREALMSLARDWENAWSFEIFGSLRARRDERKILSLSSCESTAPISYTATGVIKGKWNPAVIEQFQREDIDIDLSTRGFYRKLPFGMAKYQLVSRLISDPRALKMSLLDLVSEEKGH